MLVHFGRLSYQGRHWYSLADTGRYTLADYEWYSLADAAWYIIVRLLTEVGHSCCLSERIGGE
jgi:hypothetical protein